MAINILRKVSKIVSRFLQIFIQICASPKMVSLSILKGTVRHNILPTAGAVD